MKRTWRITSMVFVFAWLAAAQNSFGFHNPSTGKWLSRDPIEEKGGENIYGYTLNSPLNLVDPLGLDSVGDSVIDGPKKIVVLDKTFPQSQTTPYSYNGVGTVCRWGTSGNLAIPAGAYMRSINVYPTGVSLNREDSSVSVTVGTRVFTKQITVVRPVFFSRTLVKSLKSGPWPYGVRLDFNLTMWDQFVDPLPAGVLVSERINITTSSRYLGQNVITGSMTTDENGTVGDHHLVAFSTSSGFVTLVQTVIIGNWEAPINERINADGTWTGDMEGTFR